VTVTNFYTGPGGSDTAGNGSVSSPWETLTYAIAAAGLQPGAPGVGATVNLIGDITEGVVIVRHNWAVEDVEMRIDLGGHTVTNPSGSQAALLAVGCETTWMVQNGVISLGLGWACEVDQNSNILFGDGLTFDLSTGGVESAGGLLCNADAKAVLYYPLTVKTSALGAGYLYQASWKGFILDEAPTTNLSGNVSMIALCNLLLGGTIGFSAAKSFPGAYYTGGHVAADSYSSNNFYTPQGIIWP
jgi:hypothetical protein